MNFFYIDAIGPITFSMSPASHSAGENKVTISCGKTVKENSILTYELQKEINGDWTSILKANDSLMYIVNEDTTFDNFSITWFSGTCGSRCFAMFKAIVRSDTCMMDHHAFLNARCGIIQENKTIYSSEINIFSVKGTYVLRIPKQMTVFMNCKNVSNWFKKCPIHVIRNTYICTYFLDNQISFSAQDKQHL